MDEYILHEEYYKTIFWGRWRGAIGCTWIQTTYKPRVLGALWSAVRQSRDCIPAKTTKT